MNSIYSFLKDELALAEIRKHKWIESEKLGYEIGFATAAVDWIKRYGHNWKTYRLNTHSSQDLLAEKRRHRRFAIRLPVELSADNASINCHTDDISLIGMSCTIPSYLPNDAKTKVRIRFRDDRSSVPAFNFEFESRITRVDAPQQKKVTNGYNVFLPFSEEIRDYLRTNADFLAN